MIQKVFINGSNHDTRDIMIQISDEFIEFFFYEYYCRQRNWVAEETERRFENGLDELEEDEAANDGFYWINKDHWIEDKTQRLDRDDNFHKHMRRKNWFTEEMAKFINDNT